MTGIGLVLDHRLRSGSCAAVPKHAGRVSSRRAPAKPARGVPKDYCLLDERGECIGTIAATSIRPDLGKDAGTLYLRRETRRSNDDLARLDYQKEQEDAP